MYTFYFQSFPSLGGNKFRLTAQNCGASSRQLGALYGEDTLRSMVRIGYRVVIDPTPEALKELNETFTEKYPLQLALGFRAIYPPTMFAVERPEGGDIKIVEYTDYEGTAALARDIMGGVYRTEFQTDKLPATLPPHCGDTLKFVPSEQDAAFDEQSNRLEFSRTQLEPDPSNGVVDGYKADQRLIPCGEDIIVPENDDVITVYRRNENGFWRPVPVGETPKIGPLPPQAPLAPFEGCTQPGPSLNIADGLPLEAPDGTMLNPLDKTVDGEPIKYPVYAIPPAQTSGPRYGFRRPETVPPELPPPSQSERDEAAKYVEMRREGFTRMDTPTLIQKIAFAIWKRIRG